MSSHDHPGVPLSGVADEGFLLVISGPSGVGKSTVIRALMSSGAEDRIPLRFSVSATTRKPRHNERDGVDYHFLTSEAFEQMKEANGLLECAEFAGGCYGTPRAPIEAWLKQGACVLMDVEVQGAKNIKALMPDAVMIFLIPPTWDDLENRLRLRRTESEEVILRRLAIAREQYGSMKEYDYLVLNSEVHEAARQIEAVITAEICRRRIKRLSGTT